VAHIVLRLLMPSVPRPVTLLLCRVVQGCLLVNLLCASKPEYNSKFSVLALMAPVFFVQHVQQPYLRLGATYHFDEVRPTWSALC
jgi:hypothetical protein